MNDKYTKFLNAKGIAIAWIGAIIGPTFLWIGIGEDKAEHLIIGIALLAVTALTIIAGINAARNGMVASDTFANFVFPSLLLIAGIALAIYLFP